MNKASPRAAVSAPPDIAPGMVLLLAIASGLIVANLYYAQTLVGPISASTGLSAKAAGLIVTLTQVGYTLGLLFVVPLVVFQVTHSVAWSGGAFFVETLPRFLSFPVCGALCDRVSPFRLLRISQTLRAATCLLGALVSGLTGDVVWLVLVSALCGVLTTQGLMAREVMLPQVFAGFRTERVLAHAQMADQLGTVLGPLLAALALTQWSWAEVLGGTALLFLAADDSAMCTAQEFIVDAGWV